MRRSAALFNPRGTHVPRIQKGGRMAHARYYSPRLERPLIAALYYAAKAKRIPMTRLASSLVREGLERIAEPAGGETAFVREEPQTATQPVHK